MLKKGLKQVGDVHCNACLHPYFTLMCNSTTYHFQTYSFIASGIILIVVESHIKVKYGCRCALRWTSQTVSGLFLVFLLNVAFSEGTFPHLIALFLNNQILNIFVCIQLIFRCVFLYVTGNIYHNSSNRGPGVYILQPRFQPGF